VNTVKALLYVCMENAICRQHAERLIKHGICLKTLTRGLYFHVLYATKRCCTGPFSQTDLLLNLQFLLIRLLHQLVFNGYLEKQILTVYVLHMSDSVNRTPVVHTFTCETWHPRGICWLYCISVPVLIRHHC